MVQGRDAVTDSPASRQIRAQSGGLTDVTNPGATAHGTDGGTVTLTSNNPLTSYPPQLAPNIGLRTEPEEISIPASPNAGSRTWSTQVPRRSRGSRAGILGRPFAAVGVVSFRSGNKEIRDVFGNSIEEVGFRSNTPLNEHVDFRMYIGHSSAGVAITDGSDTVDFDITALGVSGGLSGHFCPDEAVDPFVFGNLMFFDMDLEASLTQGSGGTHTEIESDTAWTYQVGMGIQCELDDHIAVSPYLSYVDEYKYADSGTSIGALLNIWGGESLLFFLEVGQSLEDGSRILGGGAGLQF